MDMICLHCNYHGAPKDGTIGTCPACPMTPTPIPANCDCRSCVDAATQSQLAMLRAAAQALVDSLRFKCNTCGDHYCSRHEPILYPDALAALEAALKEVGS